MTAPEQVTVDGLLTDLLKAAVEGVVDPPDRQVVVHGNFAHDCEMVAVRLYDIFLEPIGGSGVGCAVIPRLRLEATIVRKVPEAKASGAQSITIPDAASITESSLQLATDAFGIMQSVIDRWANGALFHSASNCSSITLERCLPSGPSGGFASWSLTLLVRI